VRLLLALCVATAGCGSTASPTVDAAPDGPAGDAASSLVIVSQQVGTAGGHIEGDGIGLDIPPGALEGAQKISITTDRSSPGVSPLFHFEPSGLTFSKPIKVSIPVASDFNGIVAWSTLEDPSVFELAGYASGGMAVASSKHFSKAKAETACDDPNHEDDHADPEQEETLCEASGGVDGGAPDGGTPVGGSRPCLRLCYCMADDGNSGALCPTDGGWHSDNNCAGNDDWLISAGKESNKVPAEGENKSCQGYHHAEVVANLCTCDGLPPQAKSPESLCARPWKNAATTPGTTMWQCTSTPSGIADGMKYVPTEPAPPRLPNGFGIGAFIGEPGDECSGYYKPATASGSSGKVVGMLAGCGIQKIDNRWAPVAGKTKFCAFVSDDDRRRCRLSPREWQMLQKRRTDCEFPERGKGADERAKGPTDERGTMLITTAILTTRDKGEITGFSSRAQRRLDGLSAEGKLPSGCPMQMPITQMWRDIGRSRGEPDAGSNDNATRWHAEGGALLRYSEAVGRTPGLPEKPPSGPRTSATLIIDRRPCTRSCGPQGLDAARRAAGLDELRVHSPAGCFLYTPTSPAGLLCD
jgi:hypothetical protein